MKQFIRNLIIFIVIGVVSIIIFTIIYVENKSLEFVDNFHYEKDSPSFLYNRIREADTTKNVDVAFFGTSQTYRGIDPRIFAEKGIRIFNLGSSNQTPIQTETLVNRYIAQLNPKIVIFEINPESLSMDGIESAIDFNNHAKIDKHIIKMTLRLNSIKTWFSLIYTCYRQLLNLDASYKHPNKIHNDTYIIGGFVEKKYHPFYGQTFDNIVNPQYYQMFALKRTLKVLKRTNAEIILVQMPLEKATYSKLGEKQKFYQHLSSFGLTYYNYNSFFSLNKKYFLDNFHLNQMGVDTFNRDLIKRLNLVQKIKSNE
ncbi:MAG: hypothetical protein JEZ09_07095 [Salinivirgaceae bacterium]|nr:hypothetical protein [Salinivirgaceae bacterium]